MSPEQRSRVGIDALLQQAGWHVCAMGDAILALEPETEGLLSEITGGAPR